MKNIKRALGLGALGIATVIMGRSIYLDNQAISKSYEQLANSPVIVATVEGIGYRDLQESFNAEKIPNNSKIDEFMYRGRITEDNPGLILPREGRVDIILRDVDGDGKVTCGGIEFKAQQ